MREIKFRAWNKAQARMLSDVSKVGNNIFWDNGNSFALDLFNDYELMQFTGLKDKNGKEIYEGDIVRFARKQGYWSHNRGDIEVVKFIDDQSAQYCGFGFSSMLPLTKAKSNKVEIIGNIYENPELVS